MSGYLNFKPTGVPEIDAILRAVEVAGDAYHHTEDWGDDDNGESHIDRIQKAADAAALARRGAAMQWRPIEEAPKDGTAIILAKIVGHPDHPTALWWVVKGSWSIKWAKWWDGLEPCGLAGPTHWQPAYPLILSLTEASDDMA